MNDRWRSICSTEPIFCSGANTFGLIFYDWLQWRCLWGADASWHTYTLRSQCVKLCAFFKTDENWCNAALKVLSDLWFNLFEATLLRLALLSEVGEKLKQHNIAIFCMKILYWSVDTRYRYFITYILSKCCKYKVNFLSNQTIIDWLFSPLDGAKCSLCDEVKTCSKEIYWSKMIRPKTLCN